MLPILRILPVGGVLLAILILVLAMSPPDASRSPLTTTIAPARGALVDRERHPEMRQFLIQAALKRADELNRLRELPDTPKNRVAGLPGTRSDADPDESGSINETPAVSIPIEIGEPSSTELPVTKHDETQALSKPADTAKPRQRVVHRARRPRVAPPPQPGLFDFLFGSPYQPYEAAQTPRGNQASQSYSYVQPIQTTRAAQVPRSYSYIQPGQTNASKQPNQPTVSYTSPFPGTNPYY
jgi:hypothetical protein